MFTLDIKNKKTVKNLIICEALSLFLAVFAYVYEMFSYGQYSVHMRLMFIFPLIAGVFILFKNSLNKYFLNTALAVFANGFLVKGIIEISGRTSSFDHLYLITGCLLLFAAFVFKRKRIEDSE